MPSDFLCFWGLSWLPLRREPFGGTSRKASPERGGARHRRAEGFVSHTPHGRGGSVSRRDHNSKTRNRAHVAWAHKSEGAVKPIPSYSSGERGLGGEALLLEKRPLPPAFLPPRLFGRGPGGGASLQRSRLPRSSSSVFLCTSLGFCLTEGRGRGMMQSNFTGEMKVLRERP